MEAPIRRDTFPEFACSADEIQRRRRALQEFKNTQMTDGVHYGVIPGCGNKPALFKPGAELLCAAFGLAPQVAVIDQLENWDGGFVSYKVKCTLTNKRDGSIEAEGLGCCNSRERKYTKDPAGFANTILKMAEKRAKVNATIAATLASDVFTQDLDDDPELYSKENGQAPRQQSAHQQRQATPKPSPSADEPILEAQVTKIKYQGQQCFGTQAIQGVLRVAGKPVEQLTRSEAAVVIQKLTDMVKNGSVPEAVEPEPPARSDAYIAFSAACTEMGLPLGPHSKDRRLAAINNLTAPSGVEPVTAVSQLSDEWLEWLTQQTLAGNLKW